MRIEMLSQTFKKLEQYKIATAVDRKHTLAVIGRNWHSFATFSMHHKSSWDRYQRKAPDTNDTFFTN